MKLATTAGLRTLEGASQQRKPVTLSTSGRKMLRLVASSLSMNAMYGKSPMPMPWMKTMGSCWWLEAEL
jgi:hypothetical protein